ncbi:hypothetical protein CC78DRAFT_537915 [Lojkania enalia]|uniref:C2H2-type domain-containing protein n=1 Tax=Lojkania enalia TaxID=147567 RepID=A0A9P4N117_9PLEO|nr:hypothetical protein CC78DRAFT_537915 [Didymosphaeria enalia]
MVIFLSLFCPHCDEYYFPDGGNPQVCRIQHETQVHYMCPICGDDCYSIQGVHDHCRTKGCAPICRDCKPGEHTIWLNRDEYQKHVKKYNVCTKCEVHFNSPSNLAHHNLTHREPIFDCLGCTRKFKTYGGMIIHLEAGTCPSGINAVELNNSAALCFQWKKYIINEFVRDCMLNGYLDSLLYQCPTCFAKFGKLSSLFMHVESPSCSQTLNQGAIFKLRKWLFNCHA